MSTQTKTVRTSWRLLLLLAACPALALAQVPLDEKDQPIGDFESQSVTGNEDIPLLSAAELEEIVGPIALYPDDLLAIVLPASTYPLQIVQAARFLDELERDPSLEPDESWDDSVVALINYPEVVELLNEDLDWTWRLGEAVVAQQTDVIAAIEGFRDRAYAAGNLKSDAHQSVTRDEGVIEITPVSDDIIYVPYYEPEHVVVHQPRPVYYYYPRAYPVYYYPYPSSYAFDRGYFWGVTTAFSIGWFTDSLHVFHHSYHGHPYFGHSYWDRWWYRRPTLTVHNHYYAGNSVNISINRYRSGDYWRPQARRTVRMSDQRVTRTRYFPNTDRRHSSDARLRTGSTIAPATRDLQRRVRSDRNDEDRAVRNRSNVRNRPDTERRIAVDRTNRSDEPRNIRFRERPNTANDGRTTTPGSSSRTERTHDLARADTSARRNDRETAVRRTLPDNPDRNARSVARPVERAAMTSAAIVRTERVRAPSERTHNLRSNSGSTRTTTTRNRNAQTRDTATPQLRTAAQQRPTTVARANSRPAASRAEATRPGRSPQASSARASQRHAPESDNRRSSRKADSRESRESRETNKRR